MTTLCNKSHGMNRNGFPQDTHSEWIPISKAKGFIPKEKENNNDTTVQDEQNDSDGSWSHERSRRVALQQEKADRIFYLGYDLYARDNPRFHDRVCDDLL